MKEKPAHFDNNPVSTIPWKFHSRLYIPWCNSNLLSLSGHLGKWCADKMVLLPNIFWFSVFPFDPFVVSFALLSLAFVVFCRGYTCLRMIYKQRNLFSFVLASILSNVPRKFFEFYSTCHRVKIKSKAQRQRCEIPNADTEVSLFHFVHVTFYKSFCIVPKFVFIV